MTQNGMDSMIDQMETALADMQRRVEDVDNSRQRMAKWLRAYSDALSEAGKAAPDADALRDVITRFTYNALGFAQALELDHDQKQQVTN